MRPGATVSCGGCGTSAVAYTTGDPARWSEGGALMVSWHGYRHEVGVFKVAPSECLPCAYREPVRPPPNRRVSICDDLARAGRARAPPVPAGGADADASPAAKGGRVRLPEFITFTGADDETDVGAMMALSERFPVEWGVLFSPKRQGREPRYPRDPGRFLGVRLRLAAHLCGGIARDALEGHLERLPFAMLYGFNRVQVNAREPALPVLRLISWALGKPVIAQTIGTDFPDERDIPWLSDRSGGRGVAQATWPRHPDGERLVGYAGGIGPENVHEVLTAIGSAGPYWIDMESGVRTDDRFDLEKCRRVCEEVFGG
jgi:hypothetical protein